jgi:cytochrome b pre-mRNA-processing protein 6
VSVRRCRRAGVQCKSASQDVACPLVAYRGAGKWSTMVDHSPGSATMPSRKRAAACGRQCIIDSGLHFLVQLRYLRRANHCAFTHQPHHGATSKSTAHSHHAHHSKSHNSQIAKQYTRLLTLWPADALRPNLPFTRTIEARGLPYGVQPLSPAPSDPKAQSQSTPPPQSTPAPISSNPKLEQSQVNALFSLLENRYSKKYTLSEGVLRPTSAPDHYERLMHEIERAPKKSWWEAKLDEWKMKIRWS